MRALSVWQPWAQLIRLGVKRAESRAWGTSWRGRLAIHATQAYPPVAQRCALEEPIRRQLNAAGWADDDPSWFPRGAVVATVTLAECILVTGYVRGALEGALRRRERTTAPPFPVQPHLVEVALPRAPHRGGHTSTLLHADELHFGDYTPGRWLWLLTDPVPVLPPAPTRGRQGLFDWQPPGGQLLRRPGRHHGRG